MSGAEQDALARMPVDEPQLACEVVASHPVAVLRARHMPEVVARHLSLQRQLAGTQVHHGNARGILLRARGPPVVRRGKRLQSVNLLLLTFINRPVADDGQHHLVLTDDRLVGHPVVLRLAIDGTQACAVGIAYPCAHRSLAARLPAEYDLAGMPGVTLNVPHLEVYGHHGLALAGLQVHLADAARAGPHVARAEVGCYLFGDGIFAGELLVEAEVDELLAAVERHVTLAAHIGGNGATDALVGRLFLQLPCLRVGEKALQVHLHHLHAGAFAVLVLCRAHEIKVHRLAGHAEHARKAALRHLHDVARLFVHGHGLALHAVRAEDHPLAVAGPLVVRLVNLGITCAALRGQEHQFHAGLRVVYHLSLRGEARTNLCPLRQAEGHGSSQ